MEQIKPMTKGRVVVFSSLNLAEVHLIRSVLIREGIPSHMKSQMLGPIAGEVPMDSARAELFVDEEDSERALEIIHDAQTIEGPDRPCPDCKEMNPPSFEICWRCQATIPL